MKPKFLIFGGTLEGRQLAETLCNYSVFLTVSVATEYGESLLPDDNDLRILTKRLNEDEMTELLEKEHFTLVIDATHPYAVVVSENIIKACNYTSTPYLRLLRSKENRNEMHTLSPLSSSNQKRHIDLVTDNDCILVDSIEDSISYLNSTEGNIFVTTGSKELSAFTQITNYKHRIYARVLPVVSVLEECNNLGINGKHAICMQGPFSEEVNYALFKQFNIKYLVTKETGKAGGFDEKISAAKRALVQTIIIGTPNQGEGLSYEDTIAYLLSKYALLPLTSISPRIINTRDLESIQTIPKRKITLLSIGPGQIDYLTKKALDLLSSCDVIIGATRMIESLSFCNKPYYKSYKADEILSYLNLHKEYKEIVICYSGDIGFYSGAKSIYPLLSDYEINTIPGISSLVYFCSKLHLPWEDVTPISLHGKDSFLLESITNHTKVFALLDGKHTVSYVCKLLIEHELTNVSIFVGERLSYDNESITSGLPQELVNKEFDTLSVILIIHEKADEHIITHGLRDSSFLRGNVPMTKSEIRSISLSKLELHSSSIVYDIGSGTGSVGIEIARQCVKGYVYAIEKKEEAVSLIEENKKKLFVSNLSVVKGTAPDVLSNLPTPTHAFIGGSSGQMKHILKILLNKNPNIRVVINCIALETVSETIQCLKELPFTDIDITSATIAKSKEVGSYHMMMGHNPVTIITCKGL